MPEDTDTDADASDHGDAAPEDGGAEDATAIRPLDARTVDRIAAGEVVERPASAVKELVENSLDADASRVDVTVEGGGTERLVVSDDGVGMSEADLRAAVREHTTSKIRDIDDLEGGVGTLGFRGEALHTIGAVSRLTIRSKPRGGDRGTELVYEGGEVTDVRPAGCPEGTTVEVADLFYNTPARRKYLKTDSTEFAHVNRVVTRYALANPDVAVSLTHDGRETFATTGQGDRQGTVLSVYGREVAEAMRAVPEDATDGDEAPPGPLDGVSGLVSHPETTRSSREYVSTFVNGRYVTSRTVREAVVEAYGGQLASDRYPFAVLFLDLPADQVDVNVHPRKMEVRFDDEQGVRRQVRAAVEDALLEHGLVRSTAPRGRSQAAEADVRPEREATDADALPERDADEGDADTAIDEDDSPGTADRRRGGDAAGSRNRPAAGGGTAGDADPDAADTGDADPDAVDAGDAAATAEDPGRADDAGAPPSGTASDAGSAGDREQATIGGDAAGDEGTAPARGDADGSSPHDRRDRDRRIAGPTDQTTLGEGDAPATPTGESFDTLPPLRVLGQYDDTYLVAETPEGLALVDQHAADERVNYERLRERFAGDVTAQSLAEPVELELTAGEAALFSDYREALASLGFYAERAGDRTVRVTTVPAVFSETLEPAALRDVLATFVETADADAGRETVEAMADAFLGDLACYPSVTGNTSLTEGSVTDLLHALDDCENPWACPHGRPVVVRIDAAEIEERFERDYPGHGGRRD